MNRPLPTPGRRRWQPLRAGLVDLFYYDQEEFWFRDGRLLLRGNNGTGKSKVLALTLPFLLDGDLAPHRVEPDADPKKRMEWNLLLGGAHPHPERLGYAWCEFGRYDEDRGPQYRTLGCGLKAVAGRGMTRHWFFLTSLRPGDGLGLVDATGTALTRDRLAAAMGDSGTVYDRAKLYRRAVDETLFGLGEQRYAALVDLLIQVRAPQLSKRPNETRLSDALTEALPPLDQAVITDVAEAFRSLEQDRDALAAILEAHQTTASFLRHYRRYAQVATRRRAAHPRQAQSLYERVNRDLSTVAAAYEQAHQAVSAAESALAQADRTHGVLRARDDALRSGPQMRSARELERAADGVRRVAEQLRRTEDERARGADRVTRWGSAVERTTARLEAAVAELAAARGSCSSAATAAGLVTAHRDRVDRMLEVPDLPSDAGSPRALRAVNELRRAAADLVERQRRALRHVEELIAAAEAARRVLADARQAVDRLAAEADELAGRRGDADRLVTERGSDLVAAVRDYVTTTREITLPDPAGLVATLELWVGSLDGPNPARSALDAAGRDATARIASAQAALDAQRVVAERTRDQLTADIARLDAGEQASPPAPHTRDVAERADRPGAPLWQLVDFADGVPDHDRAGLEAALESAGILDAWVTPHAELVSAQTHDVILRPGGSAPPRSSLAAVVRPAIDRADPRAAAVTDTELEALLQAIGLGPGHGDTWVSADGRFRIGVLTGSWSKSAPVFIGHGAREAARRALLVELREQLAALEHELEGIAIDQRRLADRRATLGAEQAGLPADDGLRAAHATVAAIAATQRALTDRQHEAAAVEAETSTAAQLAAEELTSGAAEVGLPAERGTVRRVAEGLADYRATLAALWPALGQRRDAQAALLDAHGELDDAQRHLAGRTELATQASRDAAAANERHRTLQDTVGASVAQLDRDLTEVVEALRNCERDRRTAALRHTAAVAERGKTEGRSEELSGRLEDAAQARAAAAETLRRFAATGLLTVAIADLAVPDPSTPWAPDPTVRLARDIERVLGDVRDDDAWEAAQHRVMTEHKSLSDTLSRQGNDASLQPLEGGIIVEVTFSGRRTTVPELERTLGVETEERQRLLYERERVILENHLINEVASTLQELISAAETQVAAMNAELSQRPTSSGMRLRLKWIPRDDGPPGLAAARERLLRQTSDAWSETDRSAVGAFLQARIAEVRAAELAGTWLEHLGTALDYRGWHRFVIQRHQNGQWRSATGPASGGERVLAASVPLFAAASAHYASAGNPDAPRLITLDEAFAGVDDNARAKYFGLLAAFDLDVVMTSDREWGCYREVPGLAIAQLSRSDDVAAVLVTPWEWDGRTRVQVARPEPTRPPGRDPAALSGPERLPA